MQAAVFDKFVESAAGVAGRLRQGPALGDAPIDCGAMCMPGLAEKVAQLVQEAVDNGAKVCALKEMFAFPREMFCCPYLSTKFSARAAAETKAVLVLARYNV